MGLKTPGVVLAVRYNGGYTIRMNKGKRKGGKKIGRGRFMLAVTDGRKSVTLYFETDRLLQEAVLSLKAMGGKEYRGE